MKSCSEAAELRSTFPRASWKTLVISRRPTTLPSSLQTGYDIIAFGRRVVRRGKKHTRCLKCFDTINCRASVALVESRVTIGLRVMIWLTGVVCGSRPSAVTYNKKKKNSMYTLQKKTYPICQIFRCENPTQSLLIIHYKDTVCPFSSTQLASFGYSDVFRYS